MNMAENPLPSSTMGTTTGGSMVTTLQVTETEFHRDASVTRFLLGSASHFVVTNKGKTAHELMIIPRSEGAMNGMPMGDMDCKALA